MSKLKQKLKKKEKKKNTTKYSISLNSLSQNTKVVLFSFSPLFNIFSLTNMTNIYNHILFFHLLSFNLSSLVPPKFI